MPEPAKATGEREAPAGSSGPTQRPRASARGEQRRGRILEVALKMFAEYGYEGVSLRTIAESAGVDHPLVKYYFADKDALWREAVRFLFERMDAEIAQAPRIRFSDDPRRAFEVIIRALVHYGAKHPEHARLVILESVRDSERLRWAVETFVRRQHSGIGPWLEASVAYGFLPDIPRYELATMINALCHITFTLAPMVRHSWSIELSEGEQAIEAHADAVLALLAHGWPSSSGGASAFGAIQGRRLGRRFR